MAAQIKREDIRKDKYKFGEIIGQVRDQTDRTQLFGKTPFEVARIGLQQFDFPSLATEAEIGAAATELLSGLLHFKEKDPLEMVKAFNRQFLDIDELPADWKTRIAAPAEKTMEELNELVIYYETEPAFKDVVVDGKTPRYHLEYWVQAFYRRTLEKRKQITEYLGSGINEVALRFAKPGYRKLWHEKHGEDNIMELREKYPFLDTTVVKGKLAFQVDMEKLDWRKLNPMRNKIFVHRFKSDYSEGYSEEIKKEIMEDIDPKTFMDKIIAKASQYPKIKDRISIFEELKTLAQSGLWYGCYALALPQVEGIFSEMGLLADERFSTGGSLKEKTERVRAYYDAHEFYFDYYEFYLPEQRNKFSHSGKDKEIEFKSRCLMLDLMNLLDTCEGLNSPVVHLANMIAEGPESLGHIGDFMRFIRLVDETKSLPSFKEMEAGVKDFMEKFLALFDLPGYFAAIQGTFEADIHQTSRWMGWGYHKQGTEPPDFKAMTPRDIFKDLKLIEEAYEEFGIMYNESLRFLSDVTDLVMLMPRIFPDLPPDVMNALSQFEKANTGPLANLYKMKRIGTFRMITEDYMLDKGTHLAAWARFVK